MAHQNYAIQEKKMVSFEITQINLLILAAWTFFPVLLCSNSRPWAKQAPQL